MYSKSVPLIFNLLLLLLLWKRRWRRFLLEDTKFLEAVETVAKSHWDIYMPVGFVPALLSTTCPQNLWHIAQPTCSGQAVLPWGWLYFFSVQFKWGRGILRTSNVAFSMTCNARVMARAHFGASWLHWHSTRCLRSRRKGSFHCRGVHHSPDCFPHFLLFALKLPGTDVLMIVVLRIQCHLACLGYQWLVYSILSNFLHLLLKKCGSGDAWQEKVAVQEQTCEVKKCAQLVPQCLKEWGTSFAMVEPSACGFLLCCAVLWPTRLRAWFSSCTARRAVHGSISHSFCNAQGAVEVREIVAIRHSTNSLDVSFAFIPLY